jgi:hypothetical protein
MDINVSGDVQAGYSRWSPIGQRVKGQSGADTRWLRWLTTVITRASYFDDFRHVLFVLFEEVSVIHREPNTPPNRWKNKSSWLMGRQLAPIHTRFVSHSSAM